MSLEALEPGLRRLAWTVVSACLLTTLATAAFVFSPRLRNFVGFGSSVPVAYRIGDSIDTTPETFTSTAYTVIVFARSSCGACRNAQPLLAHLAEELAKMDDDVSFRILSPLSNPASQRDYVRSLGLSESNWLATDLRRLRVRVVPTAVLVDNRGRILDVSEGGGGLEPFARAVLSRFRSH